MLLKIKDLSFFKGKKEILKDINLSVDQNTIHTIIGVNGTGKTTLASIIMGLEGYEVKKGSLIFNNEDITQLSITERAKRGITLGWQIPANFEGISIHDYLNINKNKLSPEKCLEFVGLRPQSYLNRLVNQELSGGERKKVELASILAMNPKLAVLDEPDSGIDINSLKYIKRSLTELKKRGATILIISHNEFIADFSDKISLLCGGRIVKEGKNRVVLDYFKNHCVSCDHIGIIKEEEL